MVLNLVKLMMKVLLLVPLEDMKLKFLMLIKSIAQLEVVMTSKREFIQ